MKSVSVIGISALLVSSAVSLSSAAEIQVVPKEAANITAVRKAVDAKIDAMSARLIEMNNWIGANPEPGYAEFKAVEYLTAELKKNGFTVETNVPGLPANVDKLKIIGGLSPDVKGPSGIPTAFKAKYKGKTESPVVAYMVEYDALRANPPFHGCQHNQQGPTGIGAAIALAKAMEEAKVPGSVWVVGTPAEEVGPPSKALLAQAGYFKGVDFVIRSHGTVLETQRSEGGFSPRGIRQMSYTFTGANAHAQRAWDGRGALDGVLVFFHAMEIMREHAQPQFRFHGVITDGGTAPNVVPETASCLMWVRHIMDETRVGTMSPKKATAMIEAKVQELHNAAKGAAMATGTKVEYEQYGMYIPGIAVGAANDLWFQYAVDYGGANVRAKRLPEPSQYEETGYLSLVVPGIHVGVGVPGGGGPQIAGHSMENYKVSISPAGHKGLILNSKVMAASGLRFVMDTEMRKKIQDEYKGWVGKYNQ